MPSKFFSKYSRPSYACARPATTLALTLLLSIICGENAQAQPAAPQASGNRIFAPYQPTPKFAPTRPNQITPVAPGSPTRLKRVETNANADLNPNAQVQDTSPTDSGDLNTPLDPASINSAPASDSVQPFIVSPDGTPALNIVPTPNRPPIPSPPIVPPLTPMGNGIARPSQAWRVKAHQLFKQKLDATTFALDLNAAYPVAIDELRRMVEDQGLTVAGFSPSSGHILITCNNQNSNRIEKSILAMRSGSTAASTELRVLCESRNRSLTTARMKEILARLQTKFGDMKIEADSL